MPDTPGTGGRHVRENDDVHTSLVTVRQHFPAAWPQRQITLDTIVIWTITGPGLGGGGEGDDGAALARLRQEVIAVAEHLAGVEGLRARSAPPARPSVVHAVTSPIPGSPVRQDGDRARKPHPGSPAQR
jgi:hypothetical protein